MNILSSITRWISTLALAAACGGAGAQALGTESVVWVENQSFGFNACLATSAVPSSDEVAAAITTLRARATADIEAALSAGGIVLDGEQFMTMTPLTGWLACGDEDKQITFRVSAVDRAVGRFWSANINVSADSNPSDGHVIAALGVDLAQYFRGVQYRSAKL